MKKRFGFNGRGPTGLFLCFCGCKREVQKPRRTWFSNECFISGNASLLRSKIFKRDRGICDNCGTDTNLLAAEWKAWKEEHSGLLQSYSDKIQELTKLLNDLNPKRGIWDARRLAIRKVKTPVPERLIQVWKDKHVWEADHIIPVISGGGGLGFDNVRTLCVPCHRERSVQQTITRTRLRHSKVQMVLEGAT